MYMSSKLHVMTMLPMSLTLVTLTSLMVPAVLASCDCAGDTTCYRDQCRTAGQISVLAFEAGQDTFGSEGLNKWLLNNKANLVRVMMIVRRPACQPRWIQNFSEIIFLSFFLHSPDMWPLPPERPSASHEARGRVRQWRGLRIKCEEVIYVIKFVQMSIVSHFRMRAASRPWGGWSAPPGRHWWLRSSR